jgi:glycosyltransferase involved in cell wall biosynthesis
VGAAEKKKSFASFLQKRRTLPCLAFLKDIRSSRNLSGRTLNHMPPGADVSVTIFCHNEARRIGACIASIAGAGRHMRLAITVIANGTTDASIARAQAALANNKLAGRIYSIAHADKSNAINHSFTTLRQPARMHVFVDAYAIIAPDSFSGFAAMLSAHPEAVAATGIAGNGRTMKAATEETLKVGGRLHGQLHAFRPSFIDRLTQAGLRLPIGLYRGDGLLNSMACHDLDPRQFPWENARIKGTAEAIYKIPQLSPFRPSDISRQFRRKIRQMRGRMENAALTSLIYQHGFSALPLSADDMILAWLATGARVPVSRAERPFMAFAMRALRRGIPSADELEPRLIEA